MRKSDQTIGATASFRVGARRSAGKGGAIARWLILLAVVGVIGLGYGRLFTWSVLQRSPALAERICGEGARIDLALRREIEPDTKATHRLHLAEWFACRDGGGVPTSGMDLHDRIVVAGSVALAALALLVVFALRPVGRFVFGARGGPSGSAPSRANAAWRALPNSWRRRIGAAALAAVIAVAFSAVLVPVTLQFGWLNHAPGAARYFCPETGVLHPRGYSRVSAFGSSRASSYSACSDPTGRAIEDDATHFRIVQTTMLVWFMLFAAPCYFFWRWALPHMRWRSG